MKKDAREAGTPPEDEDVEAIVRRAVGGLVPTTEDEVRRAEDDGVEFERELPAGLAAFRPRADAVDKPAKEVAAASRKPADVVSLEERREARSRTTPIVTHAAFGALCAAAAAAVVFFAARPGKDVPGAGRDPSQQGGAAPPSASASTTVEPTRIRVDPPPACPSSPTECPSGRACIPSSIKEISESRYRLRVGDFAPTELGREALSRGPIDVCARVGASELACRPARVGETSSMVVLPITFSGSEGLAGVTIDVRFRGAQVALGQWSGPLGLSGKGLCNGQLVEPAQAGGDKLGTVSLFADDASYVEVGRAATSTDAEAMRARFDTALPMKLFETSSEGPARFAVVFGPASVQEAERIRWAVNDGGGRAVVSLGADFVGAPRELR